MIVRDHDDGCDIGAIEAYLEPGDEILVDGFNFTGAWRNGSGIVGWAP